VLLNLFGVESKVIRSHHHINRPMNHKYDFIHKKTSFTRFRAKVRHEKVLGTQERPA
jgi:hypothetical protein